MNATADERNDGDEPLRVLFCIGVTDGFFGADASEVGAVKQGIEDAFADLSGRFGVRVLGTMDDDQLMVGSTVAWPWTSYILADAPNLGAVQAVTNIIRSSEAAGHRLWRYLKIEARVGRPLFFGND